MGDSADHVQGLDDAGLSAAGLAVVKESLLPAVRLAPSGRESVLGGSRIGGCPDLPRGTAWPRRPAYPDGDERAERYLADLTNPEAWWRERPEDVRTRIEEDLRMRADRVVRPAPLSLVAQVDLAAVAAAGETHPEMPTTGRLHLLYDVVEQPWGFDPAQRVGFLVRHDDTPVDDLERLDAPEELVALGGEGLLPERALDAAPIRTPPVAHEEPLRSTLSEEDLETYGAWWYGLMDGPAFDAHRVGGHPSQVQGDMRIECALLAAGHATGDGRAFEDPTVRAAAEAQAPEWVLVLQVASDDDHGAMWGDSGFLYVWMRRADLAARTFDRALVVLQCF